MSAKLAIAKQIKAYGMQVIDPTDFIIDEMIDVTSDVLDDTNIIIPQNSIVVIPYYKYVPLNQLDPFNNGTQIGYYALNQNGNDEMGIYNLPVWGTNVNYVPSESGFGVTCDSTVDSGLGERYNARDYGRQVSYHFKINISLMEDNVFFFAMANGGSGLGNFNFGLKSGKLLLNYTRANSTSVETQGITILDIDTTYSAQLTIDYDVPEMKIYLNGALEVTITDFQNTDTGLSIWLGGEKYGRANFEGYIDEARIFNTILNASELLVLSNNTAPYPT